MTGTALDASTLAPLLDFARDLDLSDPAAAEAALEEAFPWQGDFVRGLHERLRAGVAEGTVCHKGEPPMRWSRLMRPDEESRDFSVDAVLMSGPGPRHAHPRGEIDLCLPVSGEPRFDGREPGWVVYGPGSRHVPTVTGGEMLIVYLLPGGAFERLEG